MAALYEAMLLLALATRAHISQLYAFSRWPAWTVFAVDGTRVRLAPQPGSLAKNECMGHILAPVVVPTWKTTNGHHTLCPVTALRRYLDVTPDYEELALFCWPDSKKKCSCHHISLLLKHLIEQADPGCNLHGHDTCRTATSIVDLINHSLE